jgi:hypothetical protein
MTSKLKLQLIFETFPQTLTEQLNLKFKLNTLQ